MHIAIDPAGKDVLAGAWGELRIPIVVDAHCEEIFAGANEVCDVDRKAGVSAAMVAGGDSVNENLRDLENAIELERGTTPSPRYSGERVGERGRDVHRVSAAVGRRARRPLSPALSPSTGRGSQVLIQFDALPIPTISNKELPRAGARQVEAMWQADLLPGGIVEIDALRAVEVAAEETPVSIDVKTDARTHVYAPLATMPFR